MMIPIYHAALFAGNGGWRFLPIFTALNSLVDFALQLDDLINGWISSMQ